MFILENQDQVPEEVIQNFEKIYQIAAQQEQEATESTPRITKLAVFVFWKRFCPKGYCVREIQTGSRIKMCESCPSVRPSVYDILLKT